MIHPVSSYHWTIECCSLHLPINHQNLPASFWLKCSLLGINRGSKRELSRKVAVKQLLERVSSTLSTSACQMPQVPLTRVVATLSPIGLAFSRLRTLRKIHRTSWSLLDRMRALIVVQMISWAQAQSCPVSKPSASESSNIIADWPKMVAKLTMIIIWVIAKENRVIEIRQKSSISMNCMICLQRTRRPRF